MEGSRELETSIAVIRNDLGYIREKVNTIDTRFVAMEDKFSSHLQWGVQRDTELTGDIKGLKEYNKTREVEMESSFNKKIGIVGIIIAGVSLIASWVGKQF